MGTPRDRDRIGFVDPEAKRPAGKSSKPKRKTQVKRKRKIKRKAKAKPKTKVKRKPELRRKGR